MHILSSSNSMELVGQLIPLLAKLSGHVSAAANDQEQNMELEEFNVNIINLMSLLGSVQLADESESTVGSEDEDDEEVCHIFNSYMLICFSEIDVYSIITSHFSLSLLPNFVKPSTSLSN